MCLLALAESNCGDLKRSDNQTSLQPFPYFLKSFFNSLPLSLSPVF